MSKYVVLHDKDGSPVYVNPEMVVAVYKRRAILFGLENLKFEIFPNL